MGYRSDVAALFYTTEDNFPSLKLYFTENFLQGALGVWSEYITEFRTTAYQGKQNVGYKFFCEDVKWYELDPDVQRFEGFMTKFNELVEAEKLPWFCEFCRIGEDLDDVSLGRSMHSDMMLNVTRSIYFDI